MDNEAVIATKSNIYAIITRRADLKISNEALRKADPGSISNIAKNLGYQPVEPGSLVKVFQTPRENESKKYIVQVLDLVRHDLIYENLYECPESYVTTISAELWPFVLSVRQEYRLKLIHNKEHCQWLTYLKLKDLVSVNGELFKKSGPRYDCIIRYIGPVQELHPVGYFFGLELLHLDQGYSPQSEDIPFSIKYISCDPSLTIFTSAEWVTAIPNEVKKKFSPKQLLSDTIEKVYTAIAPVGSGLGFNATSTTSTTQRREKKLKPKMASAQFYDDRTLKKETSGGLSEKPTETKVFGIVPSENEDFKQSVENYEKTVERQYRLHGSDKPTLTVTNMTQPPATVGILKHRRTQSTSGTKERDGGVKIQSTIMSLSDRDLVVIDKADIRESTKDETSVIVVDKPIADNVDLADLLGSNWPKQAGGAAGILNKTQAVTIDAEQDVEMRDCTKSPTPTTTIPHRINTTTTIDADDEQTAQRINNGINLQPNVLDVEIKQLQEVGGLSVGSLVEIMVPESNDDLFGVIRWIGFPPGAVDVLVGVELEEEQLIKTLPTSDGSYNGYRLFKCPEGRAVFVSPELCAIDRRFIDTTEGAAGCSKALSESLDAKMFGHVDCPPIPGSVPPLKVYGLEDLDTICGKFKGIQGHHNSCYLDATLFAMFTFTCVFDSLLFRSPDAEDIPHYTEVQKVLREEIVNPLRKNVFVRADRVMKLRKLLDQLSSVSGLTSEEKDPEEFLNSLLAQIMRVEPFLKLSSGQDSYFYQLFVEKDERLTFPTVQQLFEQSFHSSDIKLKEVPSCLIIQMPRFGKNFKMYPRIQPTQTLDVTDIIEDSPRQCTICGKLAELECRECFGNVQGGTGLECTAFCQPCLNTLHMHSKRSNHTWKPITTPKDFQIMAEHMIAPRLYMELFAVVCIETSHYVSFVKAGIGPDAPWCFFDSMADRKGEKNGYNIPEVISVREFTEWLSDDGARAVNETSTNDKVLPELAKRLFCDAYMCMYQSTEVMMYR